AENVVYFFNYFNASNSHESIGAKMGHNGQLRTKTGSGSTAWNLSRVRTIAMTSDNFGGALPPV
ncbi:hypothetical protein, partial [Brucella intermedia]|uniref:hypothetical protein n=1 Tax=Brucella intermedia TaxID=94625 RepID=UPI001AEBD55D